MQELTRLQKIEPHHGHSNLEPTDECFYFGVYTPHAGCTHSKINSLIYNFQKPMTEKDKNHWHYKNDSTLEVTNYIIHDKNWIRLRDLTWIPIPPSKPNTSADHDNRLVSVLNNLKNEFSSFDFREIFVCGKDRESAHLSEFRPTINDLVKNWEFRSDMLGSLHEPVVIFDDVITKGTSFKAAQ